MALELKPSDSLVFQRPLIHTNKEKLLLKNPNAEAIIYRIKITAPRQYCVRPHSGRIDGLGQVEVEVILKPFKAEPPLYFECKDKFLIQSARIQRHLYEGRPAAEIWHSIETQFPSTIHHQKLKCIFASNLLDKIKPVSTMTHLETTQGQSVISTNKVVPLVSLQYKEKGLAQVNELVTATSSAATLLHLTSAQDKPQPPIPALPPMDSVECCKTESDSGPLSSMANEKSNDDDNQQQGSQHLLNQLGEYLQQLSGVYRRDSSGGNTSTHKASSSSSNTQQLPRTGYQHLIRLLQPDTVEGLPSLVVLFLCAVVFFTYFFSWHSIPH